MNVSDIIILTLSKEDIITAINKALSFTHSNNDFINNLRDRSTIISFDSKVRGFFGEIAVQKYLKEFNIVAEPVAYIGRGANTDLVVRQPVYKTIEIKTSLRPDSWATDKHGVLLQDCIEHGDIKIYFYNNIQRSVRKDIYVQIYFYKARLENDTLVSNILEEHKDILLKTPEEIYQIMQYFKYREQNFFVCWNTKENIIEYFNQLPENQKTYTFTNSKQLFVRAPINKAFKPIDLINYLKRG